MAVLVAGAFGPGCAAVLGIEELPAGEEPDAGRDASAGGAGGLGQLGGACSPENARGCEAHAAQQQLICESGRWVSNGTCTSSDRCDTSPANAGLCKPVPAACAGKAAGYRYCNGQAVEECGVDLVTAAPVETCTGQACVSGACSGTCSPGTRQCNGSVPQLCDGTGTWQDETACATATEYCSGGNCTACTGSTRDCDGDAANGCEVNTNTNASHCGSCDSPCATPPGPTCASASTLRTYAASGTCSSGTCSYAPTDTVCASGTCSGGACTSVATSCTTSGAGLTDCGSSSDQDCCTSLLVSGGTFYRSYDGVSSGYTSQAYPATVSDFRLDKYEVTVGRFRRFKAAWDGGWRPAAGAGKHTHLNAGQGLTAPGGASYEAGWDSSWASNVAPTDTNLSCNATYQTWTTTAGANERRPMNCASWYEQYAFCIWDGGFLPSEAEWNYAAAGGSEQRVYPWSVPASSTSVGCANASYGCPSNTCGDGTSGCAMTDLIFVGTKPGGDGRWGQSELAGNVWEWNVDHWASPYPSGTCNNCATVASSSYRVFRGGGNYDVTSYLLASYRLSVYQATRSQDGGGRCARTP